LDLPAICLIQRRIIIWRVTTLAGIKEAHAHRFRDSFSVELLSRGVSIEIVSVLLGHSSIRITEKHYAPWVKTRQDALEEAVKGMWA
jgi:integrase/recombinase XerD